MIGGLCIDFMKNDCFIVLTLIHFVPKIDMIIISKLLITMYRNTFCIKYGFILLIAFHRHIYYILYFGTYTE